MLETLRAYGAGLLAEAGEADAAAAALAGYALRVAEEAAAGLRSGDGELAAARWLDAEDATMRQVLGWAVAHDPALALRLADALGWWWSLRGRLAGEYPAALSGGGRRRGGQRRVVRRAALARLGGAVLGRSGRSARPFHRGPGRGRGPAAVPGADRRPGRPGGGIAADGPDRRGGRRRPPRAGAGPADRGPGQGAAGPGRPQLRRRLRRRSRRGGPAGPAGRADHGRDPRRARPAVQLCADHRAGRCRGAGRSRTRRRGGPGPGPGRGRPVEPGGPAAHDRGPGPAGGPHRRRRGAPAGRAPPRGADRQLV